MKFTKRTLLIPSEERFLYNMIFNELSFELVYSRLQRVMDWGKGS